MPADGPTVMATSGGLSANESGRRRVDFGPLVHHAVELSGVSGRAPKLCHVGTASGDQRWWAAEIDEAGRAAGFDLTHLHLFGMPNVEDVEGHLLAQDVVWVHGGSVANLLAVWRVHGLDEIFPRVWQAGVVLAGVSAGSICWHVGGATDSFGPRLRAVTDGLALLPYGNGVHYDSEAQRRPAIHALVADQVLPRTYCTDDGAGLVYRGTTLVEAVAELPRARGYVVERDPRTGQAVEQALDTRQLGRR
jgi:peptidase E